MDPITASVKDFQERFHRFRRSPEARVLRVIAAPSDGGTLEKALRAEEWALDNRSPFFISNRAYTGDAETFEAMERELREHYAVLGKTFEEEGTPLPVLVERAASSGLIEKVTSGSGRESADGFKDAAHGRANLPTDSSTGGVAGGSPAAFCQTFKQFTACIKEQLEPPFLCWLPNDVRDRQGFRDAVLRILAQLWDSDVRFILLDDPSEERLREPLSHLGEALVSEPFAIDQEKVGRYFRELMKPPAKGHVAGAPPGAAAPDVEPPPRPGAEPATDEEIRAAVEEMGLPPVLSTKQAERLRRLVFEAAEASAQNDEIATIEKQRGACEICAEAGVKLEQSMMHLVLATYLMQFQRDALAEEEYRRADRLAGDVGAYPQMAQIRLGLACLLMREKKLDAAAEAYEQAAAAAVIGGVHLLYFEALRMAGTCHLQTGREQAAYLCWKAAVEKGHGVTADEIRLSSFLDIAGALIELLKKHNLLDQAQAVASMVTQVGEQFKT